MEHGKRGAYNGNLLRLGRGKRGQVVLCKPTGEICVVLPCVLRRMGTVLAEMGEMAERVGADAGMARQCQPVCYERRDKVRVRANAVDFGG